MACCVVVELPPCFLWAGEQICEEWIFQACFLGLLGCSFGWSVKPATSSACTRQLQHSIIFPTILLATHASTAHTCDDIISVSFGILPPSQLHLTGCLATLCLSLFSRPAGLGNLLRSSSDATVGTALWRDLEHFSIILLLHPSQTCSLLRDQQRRP